MVDGGRFGNDNNNIYTYTYVYILFRYYMYDSLVDLLVPWNHAKLLITTGDGTYFTKESFFFTR